MLNNVNKHFFLHPEHNKIIYQYFFCLYKDNPDKSVQSKAVYEMIVNT